MKSILAPWALPDLSLPLLGWRMLKGKLIPLGHLTPDGLFKGSISYMDREGRIVWGGSGNFVNDVVIKRMTRELEASVRGLRGGFLLGGHVRQKLWAR